MIKEYSDGLQLLNDNKDYLDTNKYRAVFSDGTDPF